MKNPEERISDLEELAKARPADNRETIMNRLVKMILTDRFELVEAIAKACGSPESHKCSCGQVYFFMPTKAGKFQPIVPEEGISHFALCRDAAHYRDVQGRSPDIPPPAPTKG